MKFVSRRVLDRLIKILLVSSAALAVGIAAVVWWAALRPLPKTSGTLRLPGLAAEVVVRRDSLGVPHIRAASLPDLYYAQGFVTAQERLWQMDMIRRMAAGTLAEVAGETAYRSDADKRILGIRPAADAAARALPPDQEALLQSYARGVNAYIANQPLPMEFRLMGYRPAPWTVADSMLVGMNMFHALTTTWRDEFFKLLLTQKAGAERTAELLITRSDRDHPPTDEATALPALIERSRVPGSRVPARSAPTAPPSRVTDFTGMLRAFAEAGTEPDTGALPGSNNWVVAGQYTASGRPMLANDPHLGYSVPGVWLLVHLQAPGMNVRGVSLPGMPTVIIGHNERIAWGATNMGADVQDVYLETFDPRDGALYLDGKEWRKVELRREVIAIRNSEPKQFDAVVTRHGPIVMDQAGERFAMRWVATERQPWSLPFFQVNAATDWNQFTEAFRGYPGPAQNFVYADVEGNIGYIGAGKIPIRPRGDGSVPVSGSDPANDWTGYIPFEQLPRVYNPRSGMVATANGRIVPDDYPYPVATKWESPDRTERIYELLKAQAGGPNARKFQPEDFTRVQMDVYSGHYRTLSQAFAAALEARRSQQPRARDVAAALRAWNGNVGSESWEASVVQMSRYELLKMLLEPSISSAHTFYRWRMSTLFLESTLRERPARWLPAGIPDWDEALSRSVERAAAGLKEQFQTQEFRQWTWGKIIQTSFAHPIASQFPGLVRSRFVVGPFHQSGNSYTVKQTTNALGQSMRMVVDFGNLDETLLTLPMGQSGHLFSSHFDDQFEAWHKGGAIRHAFSDAAVEKSAKDVLRLVP